MGCVLEINNIEVTEDRTQPGGFHEVRFTVGLWLFVVDEHAPTGHWRRSYFSSQLFRAHVRPTVPRQGRWCRLHRLSSRMTSKHLSKLVQELSGLTFSDYSSSPNDSGTASISQVFPCSRSTSSGASTRSSVKSLGPQSHLLRDSANHCWRDLVQPTLQRSKWILN